MRYTRLHVRRPTSHRRRVIALPMGIASLGLVLIASSSGAHAVARASQQDDFGRMFNLPSFAEPTPRVQVALAELGRRGGLMDAKDNLAAGPIALIVDPALRLNNPDSLQHTAGVTFVGQFVDHDMTFDTTSRLGRPTNPRTAPNARRPFFDLDSVYGDGPSGSPPLYEPLDRAKLRVESGGRFEDLSRDASGLAVIADPRNDEHIILAGLHAAFLLFHNRAVDLVRSDHPTWIVEDVFDEARRLTTWHYQWIILYEFLPEVVGSSMVDDILANGRRFYRPRKNEAFIPVEFQMAYRFGHSMVRPSYRANFSGNDGSPFFAMVFDGAPPSAAEPSDLRGGMRGQRRFIGWQTFFRFPGFESDVRPNKRIDTRLSTPLFDLPLSAIAAGTPPTSLAQRNLLRHLTWRLPSGQAIAGAMGEVALTESDLADLRSVYEPFVGSTPLWFYILREADVREGGDRLGPVGGRIVAEVFIGLLQLDAESFLNSEPGFTPSLGSVLGRFQMTDFLTFAGVADKR
jgi:Animal haem peroxidase